MDSETQFDEVRERAKKTLARLRGVDDDLSTAKTLVEALRNQRDYDLMGQLAEAVSRRDPKDVKNRRLYAQYLIDTGKATAAIDVLQPLARRLSKKDPEFVEATGLLGPADRDIKVFPIVFGEADREELLSIATLTGGRLFDGNTAALATVFKEIRGYQ